MSISHGTVTASLDKQIIRVTLKGMFNELGAKEYTNTVKKYVLQLESKPFAILINNLEMKGGTPEAYQELESYNRWLNTQNLIAKAMVIESNLHQQMIDHYSPSRKSQNTRSFLTEEEALNWLQQELCK
ncbi:STAS/SEC14 domain-containing protein [Neptuniibacter sp.]|uniref:DUF7793 family protein n=1 Tax=Neptuniibacter sp. TaxID=1962643 RepID=UPI00262A9152|nr:STAS/SEC14 domain-containing protein [Neptuniibacter sp.]MCP4597437.1 hypothetical protein [Neptuniibacter sp.]